MHPATFVIPDAALPSTVREGEATRTTWAFVAQLRFADGQENDAAPPGARARDGTAQAWPVREPAPNLGAPSLLPRCVA